MPWRSPPEATDELTRYRRNEIRLTQRFSLCRLRGDVRCGHAWPQPPADEAAARVRVFVRAFPRRAYFQDEGQVARCNWRYVDEPAFSPDRGGAIEPGRGPVNCLGLHRSPMLPQSWRQTESRPDAVQCKRSGSRRWAGRADLPPQAASENSVVLGFAAVGDGCCYCLPGADHAGGNHHFLDRRWENPADLVQHLPVVVTLLRPQCRSHLYSDDRQPPRGLANSVVSSSSDVRRQPFLPVVFQTSGANGECFRNGEECGRRQLINSVVKSMWK